MSPGGSPDLESYVRATRPALLRRARSLTGGPQQAEDLVQTVLMRAVTSWDTLRQPQVAHAYLNRALVNQAVSTWRGAARRYEVCVGQVPEPRASADGSVREERPGPDERQEIWELVQSLPPQQRRAVVLRYYEDLSEAETARVLGVSIGTVKSNTSRGLQRLRQLAPEAWRRAGCGQGEAP